MKMLSALVVTFMSSSLYAGPLADKALSYVPGGVVVLEKADEVKVRTVNGTIVEIEFDIVGNFDEASGDNVDLDQLTPENGVMSLADAVNAIKALGKTPVGEWSLDKSALKGLHYDFEGFENGVKFDYELDAKNGSLISSHIDD